MTVTVTVQSDRIPLVGSNPFNCKGFHSRQRSFPTGSPQNEHSEHSGEGSLLLAAISTLPFRVFEIRGDDESKAPHPAHSKGLAHI